MVLEQAPNEPGLEISILVGETFGKGDDRALEWSGLEQGDGFKPAVRPHSLCARRKRQRSRGRSELLRANRIAKNAVMALERDIGSASSRTTINQSRPFRVTFLVVAERFAVGAQ